MKSNTPLLALSTGLATINGSAQEQTAPRFQYSAVTSIETRLPEGVRPAALVENRTGAFLVGDLVSGKRSEVQRLVEGSLRFVQQIAAQLPTNAEDERIVDALFAKRTAHLKTRPLRRRASDSR